MGVLVTPKKIISALLRIILLRKRAEGGSGSGNIKKKKVKQKS